MAANGRVERQALGAGGAYVVGVHGVEQVRALGEVVAHHARNRHHDGGQDQVLQIVKHPKHRVGALVGVQAGHVERAAAHDVVEVDGQQHHHQAHDGGRDHQEERCGGVEHAVLPLVLADGRVYADAHAEEDGEHGGERHQLQRSGDTGGDGRRHRRLVRTQAPVPLGEDALEPAEIADDDRRLVVDVGQIERPVSRRNRRMRIARHVVRTRIHECAGQEIRHRYCHEQHDHVVHNALDDVLEHPTTSQITEEVIPPAQNHKLSSIYGIWVLTFPTFSCMENRENTYCILGKHPFVNFVFPEPLLDMPYTFVSAVRRPGW